MEHSKLPTVSKFPNPELLSGEERNFFSNCPPTFVLITDFYHFFLPWVIAKYFSRCSHPENMLPATKSTNSIYLLDTFQLFPRILL